MNFEEGQLQRNSMFITSNKCADTPFTFCMHPPHLVGPNGLMKHVLMYAHDYNAKQGPTVQFIDDRNSALSYSL